jgi:hypothetical protein
MWRRRRKVMAADDQILVAGLFEERYRGVKVIGPVRSPLHPGQCAAMTAETRTANAEARERSSATVRHPIGQTGPYGETTSFAQACPIGRAMATTGGCARPGTTP